ncbi:MAG: AmmeMemoRadiSam system protein A [Methylococcaceae bacterium]|nr:AmmeMemoRadiSam system protein A [Methylococcaceae bacterium]
MSLNKAQQSLLLQLAKDSIAYGLEHGRAVKPNIKDYDSVLSDIRATFVTLEINHQLRGCIGMLEAVRPLITDIAENAFSAAFKDPRFPPVSKEEDAKLEIHLSILTPSEPMSFDSEADLIRQLRPKIDGLIMQEGGRRGTFLPSVWESLSKPEDFLQHLKQKSGLPAHYWSDTLKVSRYECEIIGED